MNIYNKREQIGQREIQSVQFEEKESTRKCNGRAKFCSQGDKKFKDLIQNAVKGVVFSGQDHTS